MATPRPHVGGIVGGVALDNGTLIYIGFEPVTVHFESSFALKIPHFHVCRHVCAY